MKILIVEDDLFLSDALKDRLAFEEVELDVAHDGSEGLHMAIQSHPDVIITDIIMPGLNGLEMIKLLRQDEWGAQARVIALSNIGQTSMAKDLAELGVTEFILKASASLEQIVEQILNKPA